VRRHEDQVRDGALRLCISFPQSFDWGGIGVWRRENEDASELSFGAAEIVTTGRLQEETEHALR
jgi:hypothetical protein